MGEKAVTAECVRHGLQTGGTAPGAVAASGWASVPYQHLSRRWVPAVAGVIQLWTVGDQDNDVALGAQVDVFPRRGDTIFKRQPALWRHRHVHKEIDVGRDVAFLQTAIVQTGAEEVIAAAVHMAFIEGVSHGVALLGAGPAEGIVTPAGIVDNGQQGVTEAGVQDAATREIGVVLTAQCALCIVTFTRVIGIVEQRVDRLVTFQVEQAQRLP
ncbi:hypothetical protein EcWSU1_02001 [Enterobacter ludwigii]|uniref:Uncharacterized protein n=1 Tax=Enterobacter ludwigii TaxID=299767 RepID=G8LN21_9ENTR|nr:hypothetical protein EcWSU1_02001 [Enterobacter ludwigii]